MIQPYVVSKKWSTLLLLRTVSVGYRIESSMCRNITFSMYDTVPNTLISPLIPIRSIPVFFTRFTLILVLILILILDGNFRRIDHVCNISCTETASILFLVCRYRQWNLFSLSHSLWPHHLYLWHLSRIKNHAGHWVCWCRSAVDKTNGHMRRQQTQHRTRFLFEKVVHTAAARNFLAQQDICTYRRPVCVGGRRTAYVGRFTGNWKGVPVFFCWRREN